MCCLRQRPDAPASGSKEIQVGELICEPAPAGAGRPQATGTVLFVGDFLSQVRSLWRKPSPPRQNPCTPAHGMPERQPLRGQLRNSRTPCGCCGVAVVAAVDRFHGNKKTPPPNLAGVRVDGLGSGQTAACSRAWAFFLSSRNRARKTASAANTPRLGMIQTMNQLRVVKTPSALCLGSRALA